MSLPLLPPLSPLPSSPLWVALPDNGNTFTNQRGGHVGRLKEGLSEADRFEPSVVVDVDITFVFSPSGFLSKYDRVTARQVEPLHFIFDGTRDMDKEREGVSMQWYRQHPISPG